MLWGHDAHGQTLGSNVVGGDHGALGLGMTYFFECSANGNGKFATVIEGGKFGFGHGWHDVFDNGRQGKDCAIVEFFVIVIH